MSGFQFWIATARDPEGDLHWLETLVADEVTREFAERELRAICPAGLPAVCKVEVFGPFDTSKPSASLAPVVEEYDGATHIFNWARNSHDLWLKMCVISSGEYITENGRALAASNLAWLTFEHMKRAKEVEPGLISAKDILRAAVMFLDWDGES